MVNDEWITAAMTDDMMVVDLLVQLKQVQTSTLLKSPSSVIPLRWGIRLPRTRPATSMRKKADGDSSTGCSPNTPLSWSGCGGGDCSSSPVTDYFEETSCLVASGYLSGVRSKGQSNVTSETTCMAAKKLRRKKTYAELKEQESSLLKDRIHLKKELATLQATFMEQRCRNENLKRVKVDLDLSTSQSIGLLSRQTQGTTCAQRETSTVSHLPSSSVPKSEDNGDLLLDSCKKQADSNHDNLFLIPDLNAIPSEEDAWI